MDKFTHVIVTAPSSRIAAVYQTQLEVFSGETSYFCVADPLGERVGSGGGTLNALNHLESIIGRKALLNAKVAIIHSGGDSKRAPFHTVCGKAWASINAIQSGQVATPLIMLIKELSLFCSDILKKSYTNGCIVVASSDVMLDIYLTGSGISYLVSLITNQMLQNTIILFRYIYILNI
jgi:fucokinase